MGLSNWIGTLTKGKSKGKSDSTTNNGTIRPGGTGALGTLTINGAEEPGGNALAWAGLATFPNLPATVLPIGSGTYLGAQLPCGMQVIGPRWHDLDCIAAAEAIGNILHA